jgi:hypothetical protein
LYTTTQAVEKSDSYFTVYIRYVLQLIKLKDLARKTDVWWGIWIGAIKIPYIIKLESGSSVSTVSDWNTGRSGFDPQQRKGFFSSSLCVETGSEAHPASCTMDTGVLFVGTKRGRDVTLITHPI